MNQQTSLIKVPVDTTQMLNLQILGYALFSILVFGCADDSAGTVIPNVVVDAQVSQADGGLMAPDQAVSMDAVVEPELDAALDAEILPDVFIERIPDIGPILEQTEACEDNDDCGQFERCLGGVCKIDLRPDVFRVDQIEVVEPKLSAPFLQSTMMIGVDNGQLTLLIEPGRYSEDGAGRWYLGNGNGAEPYVYLHRFPIQTFEGMWRCVDSNLNGQCDDDEDIFWRVEDDSRFELIVPTTRTDSNEQCYTRMTTQVALRAEPILSSEGITQLYAELSGYLLRRDAEAINFTLNRLPYNLLMFLNDEDYTVDALCNIDGAELSCDDLEPSCPGLLVPEVRDGCFTGNCITWADCCPGGIPGCDGQPDGYPFEFSATAIPVGFIDEPPAADESNRNSNPVFENPPTCP